MTSRLEGMNPPSNPKHKMVVVGSDGQVSDLGEITSGADAIREALKRGPTTGIIRPAREFVAEIAAAHGEDAAFAMLKKAMLEGKVLPTMVTIDGKLTAAVALTPEFLQDVKAAADQEEGE